MEFPSNFEMLTYKFARVWVDKIPWVLVSELGQREGEGVGLLGLGVCRGLMEEFRLLRTAFGAAELVRAWGAVAPRKPEQDRKGSEKERGEQGMNRSAVVLSKHTAIFQDNHMLH